jgi:hypothetical protein
LQDDYIPPVRIEKIPPKENWFEWSTANGPPSIVVIVRFVSRNTIDCRPSTVDRWQVVLKTNF